MQADLFSPVKLVMLVAVAACGGLCIAGAVLALLSSTWRSRLGRVALHALWIIPVAGVLVAALSWRMHQARSQAVPAITWTTPTPLTVPATPWTAAEPSFTFPRSETFQVPTTRIRFSLLRGGLIALTGIVVLLTIGWSVMRYRRHQTTPMIQVAGVAAALVMLAAGVLAANLAVDHREAELRLARQQELRATGDAWQHQRARLHWQPSSGTGGTRPSQVLDYRGGAAEISEELAPATAPRVESQSLAAMETAGAEIVAYVGRDALGERLAALPAWINSSTKGHDARVYTSGLWATTEEADQELARKLSPALSEYFWAQHPQAAGWTPSEVLCAQSGAVAQRCYESLPMQFGDHVETMHRAYWQVQHTPEAARFLFDNWRPLAVQQRLVWLGGGILLLTLLCGAASAYFRVDAATGGRYRGRLRFAAGAVCVAGGVAAILLA